MVAPPRFPPRSRLWAALFAASAATACARGDNSGDTGLIDTDPGTDATGDSTRGETSTSDGSAETSSGGGSSDTGDASSVTSEGSSGEESGEASSASSSASGGSEETGTGSDSGTGESGGSGSGTGESGTDTETTGGDDCAGFADLVFDLTADQGFTSDVADASSAGNSWRRGDVPAGGGGLNRPSDPRTGIWSTGLVSGDPMGSSLYLADESSYVSTGDLDLGACTGPLSLVVTHWFLFEAPTGSTAEAGGIVELSDDGGTSWTKITPTAGSGYGNKTIESTYEPVLGETGFVHTTSDAWVNSTFDLSDWGGTTIRIRFVFGSSNSDGRRAGWYIDNLLISSP